MKDMTYNNTKCIKWQIEYLKNVCIKIEGYETCQNLCKRKDFLKDIFLNDAFTNLLEVDDIVKNIEIFVANSGNSCETFLRNKWIPCKTDCYTKLFDLVNKEINSTAYMLRLFANSVLKLSKTYTLSFIYNGEKLTGFWKDDKSKFKIKTNDRSIARLILGFGPSASGKTYWANNIIELFNTKYSDSFPKIFLSIDGGLARELSEVYQSIIERVSTSNIAGLLNLVTAGMGRTKSIFKSGKIKKEMNKYLLSEKEQGRKISLYVPITLGGCVRSFCKKDYKPFIDITGDQNWIGLFIYQHKTGLLCPYKKQYRCIGCTESGKNREKDEGKKYSSSAYNNSYTNGMLAIKQSKFCRLSIHNSGGYKYKDSNGDMKFAQSLITEFPIDDSFKFDSIHPKFNAIFIQDGVDVCH